MIVSSWAGWSFGCSRCQVKFNQSLEQEITEIPTRAQNNEHTSSKENNKKNKNKEYNLYNVYNESFKSNKSNAYDQYDEDKSYEEYRSRYADY